MGKASKKFKKFFKIGVGMFLLLVLGFFIYASDYYETDEDAVEIISNNKNIRREDKLTIFSSDEPSDKALIFYPGAKVEHTAYAPILSKLSEEGITCVLVEMPFNMAIFNYDAADEVFERVPYVEDWYIGGHSMGGAMASKYASENKDKVEGLILLGAYMYGNYPPEKALTIYGSLNPSVGEKIDYKENVVIIEGGNHAQFGNYGEQKGDLPATIGWKEQQDVTVREIMDFIK
ncbi:alpha/beta hydrolase family protein [Andreesenia angusta]|uniref:Alpha/beta hydrolase family protein n=1 Tax=Andreesenia angusta TaxID=39480 RepID=A0A1S1V9M5_9FIRM|nr:alpha/beta fold hydrolase [Andreesenia angusta]OHW62827.1 alpha/beta hydrolase family protein [Andreesenia angusta]